MSHDWNREGIQRSIAMDAQAAECEIDRLKEENRRLRISQLRRMREIALGLARRWAKSLDAMDPNDAARIARNAARYRRFAAACLAEIKSMRRVA